MVAWPLTGRVEELALITDTLRAESDYCGVVIAGSAGVGKTRLAAEAARICREAGWITHSVVGTPAAQSISLGAFAQWVEGTDGQLLSLVGAAISAITATPGGEPVLVTVDDAQLLDDLSAFVIHQLVRRRSAKVIITVRTGQSTAETVNALWKDGLLLRLDLQPLSHHQCEKVLQAALGGTIGTQTVQRMWDLTHGNVLFLYQLVRQELQSGRLSDTAAGWRWSGEMTASSTLIDLVDLYVGTAPDEILDVLDLIAVAEPLELADLSTVANPSVIEEAERRELIKVDGDAANAVVRFAHPLYGEVRRARMGPLRAARLRGELARTMRNPQGASRPADGLRLALLWLDSDLPGDANVLIHGASEAFLRLDLDLANRLCEAALAAGAGPEARLLYGLSLYSTGRVVEAETVLDAFPSEQPDFFWLTAVMIKAANRWFLLGQSDEAWRILDEAYAAAPPELRPQLDPLRVLGLAMGGRPADAASAAAAVNADMLAPLPATILACAEVIALGDLGQPDAVNAAVEACNRRAGGAPQAAHQMVGLNLMHADALIVSGRLEQAQSLGERLHAQWGDIPRDPSAVAVAIAGVTALARGDLTLAQQKLRAAIANIEPRHDRTGGLYWFWLGYTEALARAGQAAAAADALEKVNHYHHPSFFFVESNRLLVSAWVAAAHGRTSEAIALAGEAAEFASAHGQLAREVMSLQAAVQFGDQSRVDRLAELADTVGGTRASLIARWAAAVAATNGDELLRISEDLEAMGDRIAAADAAAHAALAYSHDNLRGSRLTASGRATRIVTECGAVTPATLAAASSLPLSDREREIATLASQGLSNKQIAETLVMSVRTVEGHVYRACTKLGLNNRSELAAVIAQHTTPKV
jgi:DNA-binding CsgD family transcriptional regulator